MPHETLPPSLEPLKLDDPPFRARLYQMNHYVEHWHQFRGGDYFVRFHCRDGGDADGHVVPFINWTDEPVTCLGCLAAK